MGALTSEMDSLPLPNGKSPEVNTDHIWGHYTN
jgi:hypothetical protein